MSSNPFAPPPRDYTRPAPSRAILPLCVGCVLFGQLIGAASAVAGVVLRARGPQLWAELLSLLGF